MFKKIVAHMLIISILLGSFSFVSFAFNTTPRPGWDSTTPDITPERQKAADAIRDVMVPNIVDKMIERFPAFEYLKDSSILYGFELMADFLHPISASVASAAITSGDVPIGVEHSLMVNLGSPRLTVLADGNFQDRSSAEHVLVHEMTHAFMFEGMRAGIRGDNEAYPLWFGEGAAQAIGGDSRRAYDTSLGLDRGAASTDEDIKGALARISDGDNTSAYAVGYLANMYLGYLASGEKGINGNDIAVGLNTIFAEILSGTSLDETIAKYTHYSGLVDFEVNLQDDTKAYDFVRGLFNAIPSRREINGGSLFGDTLMSLDIVSDTRTVNKTKLFEISDKFTVVENSYPKGVEILGGGSKKLSGKPQIAGYPKPPFSKTPLRAPNSTLTNTGNNLIFSWDSVPNAQSYEIYVYTKDKTIVGLTKIIDTSYSIPLPTKTGNYIFAVKALPDSNSTTHYAGKLALKEYDFVSVPTLKTNGTDFITINAEFNQEYSIDSGITWVSPPQSNRPNKPGQIVDFIFNSLNPGQEYNIISRVKSKKTLSLPLVVSTNPLIPSITSTLLPNGEIGANYSHSLTAGGTAPIVWSITSGALPQGLTLNADNISGTPLEIGTFNITVRAENSAGFDTQTITLTINRKNTALSIDTIPNQTFTGLAITPTIIVKDGKQTLTQGTDYTVIYSNNINAGTANVNVVGTGHYIGNSITATFQIVKASLSKPSPIEKHFFSTDLPVNSTVNISSVLPKNTGLSTYTIGAVVDQNSILGAMPTLNDSNLSFSVYSGSLGDVATIPVNVSMANYQDITVDIEIKLTSKINADSTIIFDNTQIDYGDSYIPNASTSIINPGTWQYSYLGIGLTSYGPTPKVPAAVGTYIVTATFENTTHRGEKTANLTINKIKPVLDFPSAPNISYGSKLSASKLPNNNALGVFSWSTPKIFPTVNNSGYNVTFKPSDTVNYDWSIIPGWDGSLEIIEQTVNLSVTPVPLTITAEDKSIKFGSAKPIYTAVTTGLVLQDTISDIKFTDNVGLNTSGIFKITPSAGIISSGNTNYNIEYIDGTLTIDSALTINILANAGDGGTISPAGSISVGRNENKKFIITPDAGFNIANVIVDGVSKGAISEYTFTNVDKDHTISAMFTYEGSNSGSNGSSSGGGNIIGGNGGGDISAGNGGVDINGSDNGGDLNNSGTSSLEKPLDKPLSKPAQNTANKPIQKPVQKPSIPATPKPNSNNSAKDTALGSAISESNIAANQTQTNDVKKENITVRTINHSTDPNKVEATLLGEATVLKAVLTPSELEQVYNGENSEIILNINQEDTAVPNSDKDIIQKFIEKYTYKLGKYLDININKRVGDTNWESVSKLNNNVQIQLSIPSELLAENRIFHIVRVHGGEANLLSDLDAQLETLTFETDQFSSYSLIYEDGIESHDYQEDTTTDSHKSDTKYTMLITIIASIFIMLIALAVFFKFKKPTNRQ